MSLAEAFLYYSCPKCGVVHICFGLATGNSVSKSEYSDGNYPDMDMSDVPLVTLCSICNKVLWLDDANTAPNVPVHKMETVRFLTLDEYLDVLLKHRNRNKEDEIYIRQQIWWVFSKRVKEGNPLFEKSGEELLWKENLEKLSVLLDESDNESKILLVEINRNLGKFKESERIVETISDIEYGWLKEAFRIEINKKNKQVFKLLDYYDKFRNEIFDMISVDEDFFIELISLHYGFNEEDIAKYSKILNHGDAFYSLFISDSYDIISPERGLCFNKNIHWTDELKDKWTVGFFEPFSGKNSMGYDCYYENKYIEFEDEDSLDIEANEMEDSILDELPDCGDIYLDISPKDTLKEDILQLPYDELPGLPKDELPDPPSEDLPVINTDEGKTKEELMLERYDKFVEKMMSDENVIPEYKYIDDKIFIKFKKRRIPDPNDELPLSIISELECINSSIFNYHCEMYHETGEFNHDIARIDIDEIKREYPQLSVDEFQSIYNTDRSLILLNESIWNNTLKRLFTKESIYEILDKIKVDKKNE